MEYKHLRPYKRLRDYYGPDYFGYYPVYGQSRDSSLLEGHNFEEIERALEALRPGDWAEDAEPILTIRNSHWAVGWVETLYVHQDHPAICAAADSLLDSLADYPILDADSYGEKERIAATDHWASLPLKDRVDLCREAGVSIFAARAEYIPRYDPGHIFDRCRPD